jgi:hypothetical protein
MDSTHYQPVNQADPANQADDHHGRASVSKFIFFSPLGTFPNARFEEDGSQFVASDLKQSSNHTRCSSPPAELPISVEGELGSSGDVPPSIEFAPSPLKRAGSIIRAISLRRDSLTLPRARFLPPTTTGETSQFQPQSNPLRGNSLGIFPPDSKIRTKLLYAISHTATEICILLLIILHCILLVVDTTRPMDKNSGSNRWGNSPINYAILAIFVLYTLEIVARVIVCGLILNPKEYSTPGSQCGALRAFFKRKKRFFAPGRKPIMENVAAIGEQQKRPSSPTLTELNLNLSATQLARQRLAKKAFLRWTLNQLDFIAMLSFWIGFALTKAGLDGYTYIFQMLSCLRLLRLLFLTLGSSVGLSVLQG